MKKKNKAQYGAYQDPWQIINPNGQLQYPKSTVIQTNSNVTPLSDQYPIKGTNQINLPNVDIVAQRQTYPIPGYSPISPTMTPLDTNVEFTHNYENIKSKSPKIAKNIGGIAASIGKQAGRILSDAIPAGLQALNTLIPDNHRIERPYDETVYNPYDHGTGSTAIYKNGGNIKNGIKVIYEDGDSPEENIQLQKYMQTNYGGVHLNTGSEYNNQFIQPLQPLPMHEMHNLQKTPLNKITYEQLLFGNNLVYSPIFRGNWSNSDIASVWNQIPDYIENNQVLKGDAWKGVNTMRYGGEAEDGIHINPSNKGKFNALKKKTGKSTEELTHSKNPLTRKRAIFAQNFSHWNKGEMGLNIGDEIELTPEQYNHYKSLGYEFES